MPLLALLVATPVFGFSLSLDPAVLAMPAGTGGVALEVAAALPEETASALAPERSAGGEDVASQMARRGRIGRVHRAFGIATWSAMTVTVVLGTLQYRNLYGFFSPLRDTPCVRGDAVFGQDACTGTPVPHLVSAAVTSALYATTFGLSYAMPDPLHLARGDSAAARRLRTHTRLRWVHFGGMVSQLLLGLVIAHGEGIGLDRANDYRTLQALATVHMLTGFATYGTLTWAGALMVRR